MPMIDFIGPSYTLRSVSADCQRTINMYPDLDETGKGKSNVFLTGTPGLKEYININSVETTEPVRGMFVNAKDRFFAVCGYSLIEFTYNANEGFIRQRIIGNLNTNTGPVSIAESVFELAIVDGDNYYIYTYEDDTFSQYQPEGWVGSNTVSFFSSYFVFVKPDSQQFYISKAYDGKTIDPLDFASKEGQADNLVTTLAINQYLWLFGKRTIEIYNNTGAELFPIEVMNGGLIQYGCSAPFSVALVANMPIWLGRDDNGAGTIYMCENSYSPVRISNFAIEHFMQNLDDITDAVSYSYQQEGHYFYVINFPSGGTTWVYDVTTKQWHERQFFNLNTAQPERHRSQYHVLWNNKHLVSDYSKNIIYEMSLDHYTDNGNPIQRIRRSPHQFGTELERIIFSNFQLDLDVGSKYEIDYENIPKINLRYSSDAGKTWSNLLTQDLWKNGDYTKRLIWRRLGQARDRVWEVSCSDPVKITWLNALINGVN